jgi:hypothetical protein
MVSTSTIQGAGFPKPQYARRKSPCQLVQGILFLLLQALSSKTGLSSTDKRPKNKHDGWTKAQIWDHRMGVSKNEQAMG